MANRKYKQICFNELTLSPLCEDEAEVHRRVSNYAKTFKEAQKELGTKVIRYPQALSEILLSTNTNLQTYCVNHKREPEIIAILSSHTMPLEDYKNNDVKNVFDQTRAIITKDSEGIESRGLAAAYSYNVPSIGFVSEGCWGTVMHNVTISDFSNMSSHDVSWPCLTKPEHFAQSDFKTWLSAREELELVSTEIPYEDKIEHVDESIRDDHGKDVLIKHAKLLCRSQYVIGVLTSLPFQPKFPDYIYKIYPDGLLDIVLHRDDRGLSMRIKTTGRTIQETTKIASILKKKYNR